MTHNLLRYQRTGHTHFVTFSCYGRQQKFSNCKRCDLFLSVLEELRRKFAVSLFGYVVMPEHVHLLLSEPHHGTLADTVHDLKVTFVKRLRSEEALTKLGPFWQKRYHDRNIRDAQEFSVKLRYLHRNPVKRGLVVEPGDWKWSSFRHYAFREVGPVEIESEWTARDREGDQCGGPARTFLVPR